MAAKCQRYYVCLKINVLNERQKGNNLVELSWVSFKEIFLICAITILSFLASILNIQLHSQVLRYARGLIIFTQW